MTAPRAREQSDPPSPPERRPPRRGGGSSPSPCTCASAAGRAAGPARPRLARCGLVRSARALAAAALLALSGALALPAQAQTTCTLATGDVWCGVVTVGEIISGVDTVGYGYSEVGPVGSLSSDTFSIGTNNYNIYTLRTDVGTDTLVIEMNRALTGDEADSLVLHVGSEMKPFSDYIPLAEGEVLGGLYWWTIPNLDWSSVSMVTLRLTAKLSTDATLSALALGTDLRGTRRPGGVVFDQPFASGTTVYTATVGNDENDVQVLATVSDADATIEYLDASDNALSDPDDVDLSVGSNNVIKVKVTAEDGTTTLIYTVTVTRVADVALTPPSDALVSTLGRGTGTTGEITAVSQAFTTGSNAAGYTLTGVDVASASSTGFTAQVCGTESGGVPTSDCTTLTAPVGSGAFPVGSVSFTDPGNTVLTKETTYAVVVTATGAANTQGWGQTAGGTNATSDDEDAGSAVGWSVADLSRLQYPWNSTIGSSGTWSLRMAVRGSAVGGTASTDATLSALMVNDGSSDLTLVPTFASGTTAYTASVANSVDGVTVTPTTNHASSTVEYLDASDAALADADTNAAGHQVTLSVGANVFKVKVTAEDGTSTQTYTVAVTRAAAMPCTLETGDIWCGVLTVGSNSAGSRNGYHSGQYGQLSDTKFDLSSTEYTVESIRWVTATGERKDLILDLDALPADDVWQTWRLQVDASKYQTTHAGAKSGAQIEFPNAYGLPRTPPALNTAVTVRLTTSSTGALGFNAELSALTVNDGNADLTLSPAFDRGTHDYTTSVASGVETVTFTATAIDDGSVVYRVGTTTTTLVDADAMAAGFQVTLEVGANVIDVNALSEDGGFREIYRVTVTRAGAVDTPTSFAAEADDAQVTLAWDPPASGSGVTGHEYRFVTFTIGSSYNAGVDLFGPWTPIPDSGVGGANEDGYTVTELTSDRVHIFQVRAAGAGGYSAWATSEEVTPTVADDFPADTTTSGVVAVGGSATGTIGTVADTDWFKVVLDAGKTYQIDMEGSETGRGDLDDPRLVGIYDGVGALVLDLTLDPGIDDGGQGFNSRATFTPSAAGTYYVEASSIGSSTGGYTLFVREAMPADATLIALMVNDGSSDLTLTPAFASGTYAYAASVANAVDEVTVTPTTSQASSTVAWLDADDNALADADTLTGRQDVALAVGDTVFKVKVTGGDGTSTQTYTVTVTRAASANAPTNFEAAVGDAQVELSWDAPDSASGVTRHEYRFKAGTGSYPTTWEQIANSGVGGTNEAGFTVTSLTNEVVHTFQLRAVNAAGDGNAADADPVTPTPGICGRTQKVHEAIVYYLENDYSVERTCAAVNVADLASFTGTLEMSGESIASLKTGDFAGLTNVTSLGLGGNTFTTLPANVFSGLSSLQILTLSPGDLTSLDARAFSGLTLLENLDLVLNELGSLPDGVFSGLSALTSLNLNQNELGTLPANVFDDLSALEDLRLNKNALTSLDAGLFSGLSALETLDLNTNDLTSLDPRQFSGLTALDHINLNGNDLTALPDGVFSGLTSLKKLRLRDNDLTALPASLPEGVFSGLTGLTEFNLGDNPDTGDTLPLTVTLEKFGTDQARAKVLAGAPAAVEFTATVVNGALPTGVTKLAVAAGSVDGTAVTVTRTSGSTGAVTVDIDLTTQPSLPTNHSGYTFAKAATGLPVEILRATDSDATLSALVVNDGSADLTLTPAFSPDTYAYAAAVARTVETVTVTPTKTISGAAVAYLDAADMAIADADTAAGQQVSLDPGENTIKVRVTATNTTDTLTYTLTVRRARPGICDRTEQIRTAILAEIAGVTDCADVTATHLEAITTLGGSLGLGTSIKGITALKPGDFAGLTSLTLLNLSVNQLTALPAGIFSDLTAVTRIFLDANQLASLPAGVFAGLTKLTVIALTGNSLTRIPAGLFADQTGLADLTLEGNRLTGLPDGTFAGIAGLSFLDMDANPDLAPFAVTLEKRTGAAEVRAVIPVGAPFAVPVPVALDNGALAGDATAIEVPAGATESAWVAVTRTAGTTGAVTADVVLSTQPTLPSDHTGYAFGRGSGLPVTAIGATADDMPPDAPAGLMAAHTTTAGEATLSWTAATGVASHQYRFRVDDGDYGPWTAIADSASGEANAAGFTVTGLVNGFPHTFQVRARGAGTSSGVSNEASATPGAGLGICGRTRELRDDIVERIDAADDCAAVTATLLAGLELLNTSGDFQLRTGDLDGLTGLKVFSVNDRYQTDVLFLGSGLVSLPAGIFSDLTNLQFLYLGNNRLSTLPGGVFGGLSKLKQLSLHHNQLTALPDGVFEGLTKLEALLLTNNPGSPFAVPVNLEKVGTDQVRAVVPTGAPFELALEVSLTDADPATVTLTVERGAVESDAVTVARAAGKTGAVVASLGTLPSLPTSKPSGLDFTHGGYALRAGAAKTILPESSAPQNFMAAPGDGEVVLSWDAPASDSGVTKHQYRRKAGTAAFEAWTDIANSAAGEANQAGFTVTGLTNETEYTFEVKRFIGTSEGAAATDTVTPTPGICDRTQQVRDAIVARVSGAEKCNEVTVADLAGIGFLLIDDAGLTALEAGDFAGLTGLESLNVVNNPSLTALPSGVFSGLTSATRLTLSHNGLETLPADVFSGLTALEQIVLFDNALRTLPAGVFSGLTQVQNLALQGNKLTMLPADVFDGLTGLSDLQLQDNELTSLPETVFSGLRNLEIDLSGNDLDSLPAGLFSGLGSVNLDLSGNDLDSLPAGLFSGLGSVPVLDLGDNPDAGDTLPLTVELEQVEADRVKAKVHAGAPFDVDVPVAVASGTLAGGATVLRVATGAVESAAVAVTRTQGTFAALTVDVDLSTQPTRPEFHQGYAFARAAGAEAVEIEPSQAPPLPAPTNLEAAPGDRQVVLSWDEAASDSGVTRHEYRYEADGERTDWTAIPDSGPGEANASRYPVPGLANGRAHVFELRAVGDEGEGAAATVTVEPAGPPRIVSVVVTSGPGLDGDTYGAGEEIRISVTFDQPVEVTGDPELALEVGGESRLAQYDSGGDTDTLLFVYVVQASDDDDDGIEVGDDALRLDSGDEIDNGEGDLAELAHDGTGAQPGHMVDGGRRAGVHTHQAFTHSHSHARSGEWYPEHEHAGHEHADKANGHPAGLRPGEHVHHEQEQPHPSVNSGPDLRTHDGVEHTHRCYDLEPSCNQGDDYKFRGDELGLPIEVTHSHENSEPGHGFDWTVFFEEGGSGATVSVADAGAVGGEDAHLRFEVTLEPAQAFAVRVDYATADGTAAAGEDYTETSGVLEIAPGETRATVRVPLRDRAPGDGDVTLTLTLNWATAAWVPLDETTGTIRAPEATTTPVIEGIGVASTPRLWSPRDRKRNTYGEGENIRIAVRFDQPVLVEGDPKFALEVGDPCRAVCAADYESGSGTDTLVFAYLVLEVDVDRNGIAIPANPIEMEPGDSIRNAADQDADLTFKRKGTQSGHKVNGSRTAPPHLSVADAEAHEADGAMAFTVRLEPHGLGIVTVDYATADGTGSQAARAGSDYTETSGTLRFNSLETERTVTVPIIDDTEPDDGETFTLTLSNEDGAELRSADAKGTGTIRNSEPREALTASFEDVPAAHDGSKRIGVRVRFNAPVDASEEEMAGHGVQVQGGRVHSAGRVPAEGDDGATREMPETGDVHSAGRVSAEGDGGGAREMPETGNVHSAGRVPAEGDGKGPGTHGAKSTSPRPGSEESEESGEVVWQIEIEPDGDGDVTVSIEAGRPCDEEGAICTADGRTLSEGISTTVEGPATGPALTASFEGMPEAHDGESAFTFQVAFSEDIGISYRSLREDAFEVAGGRVTRGARVDDRRDLFEMTVEPDGGGEVTVTLPAGRECSVSGAICTKGENRRQLTNAPAATVAGPEVETAGPALTAAFEGMPAAHDGESAFRFRVAFSEDIGISYRSLREDAFEVAGGRVTRGARVDDRRDLFEMTVEPDGGGAVTVTLPAGRECSVSGAICTKGENRRQLTNAPAATVAGPAVETAGPALTASFVDMPSEHDGETAFKFRIAFSEEVRMSGRRLRSDVVAVSGGRATKAGRVKGRKDLWKLTVRPDSLADVTVTLSSGAACDSPEAVCTSDGRALSNTISATVRGPVAVSVADARAREGEDETIDFAVSLSRAASGPVSVAYATADGTARAGSDYRARKGKLKFAPGETEKTVSVPVLDDAHDEGEETMRLRLLNASGAVIADGVATGTIENTDHMPAAWLARFGRTVTDQVLDAVEARLAAPRAAGARATLAGQALPSWDADGDDATAAANPGSGSGAGDDADASGRVLRADARDRDAMAALRDWMAHAGANAPGSGAGAGARRAWDGNPESDDRVRSRALTGRDFMTGTSFELTGGSAEAGGYAALWGRGAISRFDGREGELALDGEVTTGLVGADWAAAPDSGTGAGRWTAGLAVGHARGTGSYREGGGCTGNDGNDGNDGDGSGGDGNGSDGSDGSAGDGNDPGASGCSGEVESTLTGLWPYAGFRLTDRLSAWAALGYGAGELTLTPGGEGDGPFTADLTMAMGAAGLRGEVLVPPPEGGLALAVKGDTRFTRTQSKATRDADGGRLAAATGDVWLLRLGVEGSRRFALGAEDAGATLTPRFEVGARLDGGDAETGAGADVGAGVTLAAPRHGLMLVLNARGLLAHEASGFRESGASASLTWDPRPATERGLALTLRRSWGGSPAGGMDALLGRGTLAGLAPDDAGDTASAGRLEAELGYGIPAFGGAVTATPHLGFGLTDTGRDYRLGWRLTSARKGTPGFELGLEATRREAAAADAEHALMLRGAIRW